MTAADRGSATSSHGYINSETLLITESVLSSGSWLNEGLDYLSWRPRIRRCSSLQLKIYQIACFGPHFSSMHHVCMQATIASDFRN